MNAIQTPPWETTPEQDAAIEAAKARLTAERVPAPPFSCETHEAPGSCTERCVSEVNMMVADAYYDDTPYDPTGCSNPKPMPREVAVLDADDRACVVVTEHPEDCQCGKPECPQVIADDAFWSVVGEERRTEQWVSEGFGPWKRVR